MTQQTQTTSPTFWQRLGRFGRALVRLLLFALAVALIIVAIYFASPYVYRYTMLPVQNNRALLEHLQRTQTQLGEELSAQLDDQRQRIAQLETELAAEREARSRLENELAGQAETLAAQTELTARLDSQEQAVAALQQKVEALDTSLAGLDRHIAEVQQAVTAPESGVGILQRQVLVLQMSQALLKARLHLTENDGGQAKLALGQAGQALAKLKELSPAEKQADLTEIETQLDTVTAAIEERPFIALQELEILWQLLQTFAETLHN